MLNTLPIRPRTAPPALPSPYVARGMSDLSNPFKSQEEKLAESVLNPELFAEVFLQTDLWRIQGEILQAILLPSSRTAVKACHASSKTRSAAIASLWFLARYQEAVVVTTAPTWAQVEKLLWGEIHAALAKSRYPYPEAFQTELRMGPKRYAYGLSTSVTKQDEGVKFQGIHADNVLVILDEAPGVDPKIWIAIEGARAGGNVRILALGNPTISSGPFHEAFSTRRSGWKVFTISAFDTPNFEGICLKYSGPDGREIILGDPKGKDLLKLTEEELDQNPRPYLTTRRWVREKFYEWGPGHPLWEARVLGQFPKQSEDALLSLSWLEALATADLKAKPDDKVCAGIDVAGPGEAETTLCIRKGPQVLLQKAWPIPDPRGEIVATLLPFRDELEQVNVDSIGIGWYLYLHLKEMNFKANPVNITEASQDSEKYLNQKSEFFWGLRLRLAKGEMCGTLDETTIGQLAGIRYKHNARGQIEIESKEQAAKRGVKSPDRAEAVMLAFANKQRTYGVLDYLKQEGPAMAEKIYGSRMIKPGMSDNQLSCPKCNAVCVVRAQGGWRCNQCGNQFAGPGDKVAAKPTGTSRTDALKKLSRA